MNRVLERFTSLDLHEPSDNQCCKPRIVESVATQIEKGDGIPIGEIDDPNASIRHLGASVLFK